MSSSDPIPAAMVHLPADKVEALRTTHTRWEVSDSDDAQATLNLVAAVRAAVDAATPAASVPAADILALAEEWTAPIANWLRSSYNVQDDSPTAQDMSNERLAAAQRMTQMRDQLRALVAAAEQADKGEAADTPRDEEAIKCPTCGVAGGWNEDGRLTRGIWTLNCVRCGSFQVEIEDAPAAPPEPLCEAFGCHDWRCQACKEKATRVPVNDEAEAASRDELIELVGDALGHSVEGCTCFADGTNQMCAVCIPVAVAIVDALAARQGGNSDE